MGSNHRYKEDAGKTPPPPVRGEAATLPTETWKQENELRTQTHSKEKKDANEETKAHCASKH